METDPPRRSSFTRRWLARLAFSFILLAVVFAWEGYRAQRGDRGHPWKPYAFFAAAALCFGLGLRGVHERHRAVGDLRPESEDEVNPDDARFGRRE